MGYSSKPSVAPKPECNTSADAWSPALTFAGIMMLAFQILVSHSDVVFALSGALLAAGSARAHSEHHRAAYFASYVGLIAYFGACVLRFTGALS